MQSAFYMTYREVIDCACQILLGITNSLPVLFNVISGLFSFISVVGCIVDVFMPCRLMLLRER